MEQLTRLWRKTPRDTAYCVQGKAGAVHFWFMDCSTPAYGPEKVGGVEIHRIKPADYQSEEKPSHETCWLLNAPCWHDGSSMMASETYIPMWEGCDRRGDFDYLWLSLESLYREHFPEMEAEPTPQAATPQEG